jgi:hypothetical protein
VLVDPKPLGAVRGIWGQNQHPNQVAALHTAPVKPNPEKVAQGLATILGRYPTQRDVEILANTLRLFALVPGSYGPTAVKSILQGKSESFRDRPEFSMAADKKEFPDNRLTLLAFGIKNFIDRYGVSEEGVLNLVETIGKYKADPRFATREGNAVRIKPSKKEFDANAKSRIDMAVISQKYGDVLRRAPKGEYPGPIIDSTLAALPLKRVQEKTKGSQVTVSYELDSNWYGNLRIPLKGKAPSFYPDQSDLLVAPHIRLVLDKTTAEVLSVEHFWRLIPRINFPEGEYLRNLQEILVAAPELDPSFSGAVPVRNWEEYVK